MDNKDVIDYIKEAYYDPFGTMIFAKEGNDIQMLADVRGWGRIQHMFKTEQEAENFQDKVGQFIVDAINEKIERESNG